MRDQTFGTIDLLDADEGVFSDTDAAAFADPASASRATTRTSATSSPSRGRWVVPTFAALFACISASIVVAAVAHSRDDAASVITAPTYPSRVTAPAPALSGRTSTLALDPPPFLAEAPPGFSVEHIERNESPAIAADGTESSTGEYSMELWATSEALSPNSVPGLRAWFSVTRTPVYASRPLLVGAYRMVVGDVEVRIAPPTAERATTAVEFALDRQLVHIDSFGWYARPLQKLVAFIAGGGTDYSTSFVTTDHRLVYSGPVRRMIDLTTVVRQTTTYVDRSTGFERSLRLTVGPATDLWPAATTVALTDRTDLLLRISGFDGAGVFGRSVDEPGSNVLQWVVNGWLLTARGDLSRDELVAFAESSYAATLEQYERFAESVAPPGDAFVEVSTDVVPISAGPTLDSVVYSAALLTQQAPFERRLSVIVTAMSPASGLELPFATLPIDRPMIQSIADGSMTLVVASAPPASAATDLRVNVTGSDPMIIPLTSITGAADPRLATYFFTTAVPFTAELVDASGAILLNWPETAAAG